MNSELQLLIDAIKSLKIEDNVLKDYVFPVASAFFTSLLGGAVAYLTFKHQDAMLFEKEKLNITNKWTIIANDALCSLQSIKQNYYGILTSNPYQRMLAVPLIIIQSSPILESISELSFICPKGKNGKPEYIKWSQVPLIQTLFNNYNFLLELWKIRNELIQPIKYKLMYAYSDGAYCDLSEKMIRECIDPIELSKLIDVTEKLVRLTDDIIIELNDFLCNFSDYAKSKIKTSKLKNYGSIIKFHHTFDSTKFLQKNVAANYEIIAELFGKNAQELENRYRTGYEIAI